MDKEGVGEWLEVGKMRVPRAGDAAIISRDNPEMEYCTFTWIGCHCIVAISGFVSTICVALKLCETIDVGLKPILEILQSGLCQAKSHSGNQVLSLSTLDKDWDIDRNF